MKKILLIAACMLIMSTVVAQDCYKSTRAKGVAAYKQGKKQEARKLFVAAQSCPDKPANNDLNVWINRIDNPVDNTVSIEVLDVEFVNAETGDVMEQPIYTGDMKNVNPRIDYMGVGSKGKTITINTKLLSPSGTLIANSYSPKGYTSMRNVTSNPNKEGTAIMSAFSNFNEGVYSSGIYTYEVWYQNNLLYSTAFQVSSTKASSNITLSVDGATEVYTNIQYNGGHQSYTIKTNAPSYEVTNKPSWCNVISRGPTRLEVSFDENPNQYTRSDYITVTAGSRRVIINLQQDGKPQRKEDRAKGDTRREENGPRKAKPSFCVGVNLNTASTTPSFTSSSTQSAINYGVNNLDNAYTSPDYSGGVGFGIHGDLLLPLSNIFGIETGLGVSFLNYSNTFHSHDWKFTTDGWTTGWNVDQKMEEKYHFTYLEIPALPVIYFEFGNSVLKLKAGPVFGIGLSANVNYEGKIHETSTDGQYYRDCELQGSANLFSGKYVMEQNYTSGDAPHYSYESYATPAYKRMNLSLRFGADYIIKKFLVGIAYNIGISNIANSVYWDNPSDQVPGFYNGGEPKFHGTANAITGYKQSLSSFNVTVGIKF